MDSIQNETFRKVLLELFSEAYDGPSKGYTWFIDMHQSLACWERLRLPQLSRHSRPSSFTIRFSNFISSITSETCEPISLFFTTAYRFIRSGTRVT